jgi:hypothetical protein
MGKIFPVILAAMILLSFYPVSCQPLVQERTKISLYSQDSQITRVSTVNGGMTAYYNNLLIVPLWDPRGFYYYPNTITPSELDLVVDRYYFIDSSEHIKALNEQRARSGYFYPTENAMRPRG